MLQILLLLMMAKHSKIDAGVLSDAKAYAKHVAEKMWMWDADSVGQYERVEIAQVKRDLMQLQGEKPREYMRDFVKLKADCELLLELDERLKRDLVI